MYPHKAETARALGTMPAISLWPSSFAATGRQELGLSFTLPEVRHPWAPRSDDQRQEGPGRVPRCELRDHPKIVLQRDQGLEMPPPALDLFRLVYWTGHGYVYGRQERWLDCADSEHEDRRAFSFDSFLEAAACSLPCPDSRVHRRLRDQSEPARARSQARG